jgi:Tfp pilus assembly protein PilP
MSGAIERNKRSGAVTTGLVALASLLLSSTALRAQINPATALGAAKAAAQAAQPAPAPQPRKSPAAQSSQSTGASKSAAPQNAAKPAGKAGKAQNPPANGVKTVPAAAKPSPPAPAAAPKKEVPKKVDIELPHEAAPLLKTAANNRRDPFSSLINRENHGLGSKESPLPPGKAGLQVESLIIQGLLRGPFGMIAVVENQQQRVYFLHEGDSLFDGRVDKINIDSVVFHEVGKDAFGKPLERDVTRRLIPSSGEQP